MVSFFGILDNVYAFSDGFDLISDQLSELQVADILSEIEDLQREYPDDSVVLRSCESLLTILGDDEEAIDLLRQEDKTLKIPNLKLRYASHCAVMGDLDAMEESLRSLLKEPGNSGEKLGAFFAAGRLEDRDIAIRLWKELLEDEDLVYYEIDKDVVIYPEDYSCLAGLPFRETNEGIKLLLHFDILDNRDVEIYSFALLLQVQMQILDQTLFRTLTDEGPYEALPGFIVANAIADGAYNTVENYRNSDLISEPQLFQALENTISEIQGYKIGFAVGEMLIKSLHKETFSDPAFLETLKKETGGDEFQIYEILEIIKIGGLESQVEPLLDIMQKRNPGIEEKVAEKCRMRKALWGYYKDINTSEENPDEKIISELDHFINAGLHDEAFEFLKEYMKEGKLRNESRTFLNLAGKTGRFDEIIEFIPVFEEEDAKEVLCIIKGYERISKKDLKSGIDLINRAVHAGYPEGEAMLLLSRFLNQFGYPKRTIGICEKLLKKSDIPARDIYPILIEAFRIQGKEEEATATEKKLKNLTSA